ncbi:oxidative damage protection protein [Candidatus Persebacteraceae bacterium Df01]|jgi:Fe-S cluster biosynthesis and repair protein YggX|uniref:Probable Fe(2+)-trafficking protein n=1 Tax=Candidatus Doriopsillibacter californiensis TaxID=2970740 RepID=A0ABT7QK72_9GAMM|nr:oxidative damage protection protein [Candidatus Persebacteraceae bacterium Df01]
MSKTVFCIKLKKEAEAMVAPPYPGELGQRLLSNVSAEAWRHWLEHQKMLVNEYRLNMADRRAREYLAEQTERHFFGDGAETASGYVPPAK